MTGWWITLLPILLLGGGSPQPPEGSALVADNDGSTLVDEGSGGKQSGSGTCTCESRAGGDRRILQCLESTSYDECSSYCHNAYPSCDSVHFETGAPSCFDILNGDADWGGQRF